MESIVSSIEANHKNICRLLKMRICIIERIQTKLDLKAHAKIDLTENQIAQFKHFTHCYEKESAVLQEALTNLAYTEALRKDNVVLHIYDNQFNAISSLDIIIEEGKIALSVL